MGLPAFKLPPPPEVANDNERPKLALVPPGQRPPWFQIEVVLTERQMERLEEITRLTGAAAVKDVVRAAMSCFDKLHAADEAGDDIFTVRRDSDCAVTFPF